MSNTRRSKQIGAFNPERFASSIEHDIGLSANLVAKRCKLLKKAADRELILFLQYFSDQPGGLAELVERLLEQFPERFATPTMRQIGCASGQRYDASQVNIIRQEMRLSHYEFPLKGEDFGAWTRREAPEPLSDFDGALRREWQEQERQALAEGRAHPESYPACAFMERCRDAARKEMELFLRELCLNPALKIEQAAPWYCPGLIQMLRDFEAKRRLEMEAAFTVTALGARVCENLDYALNGKCCVVQEGKARTGKTFAARHWCQLHPGRARYVQVPASSDDISFFRKIAEALGVASGLSMKGVQMRERIEDVVQSTGLMLVFDEAHYLWPQNNRREALPNRINWIMTELVNYGVPVCLMATDQFTKSLRIVEAKTGWSSEQFKGRIKHHERLPDTLADEDLQAVVRAVLPGADAICVKALVLYAKSSEKYLAGIDSAVSRACYLAQKDGRESVTIKDISGAIKCVIPSDTSLAAALEETSRKRRGPSHPAPRAAQPGVERARQTSLSVEPEAVL